MHVGKKLNYGSNKHRTNEKLKKKKKEGETQIITKFSVI
jgi:hypothetical protein